MPAADVMLVDDGEDILADGGGEEGDVSEGWGGGRPRGPVKDHVGYDDDVGHCGRI